MVHTWEFRQTIVNRNFARFLYASVSHDFQGKTNCSDATLVNQVDVSRDGLESKMQLNLTNINKRPNIFCMIIETARTRD